MGKIKKIGVVSTNRAEKGLLAPILKRIKDSNKLDLQFFDYTGKGFIDCYIDMREELITDGIDLMIIPADRQEMLGAAIACFYLNVPIAHFLSGSAGSGVHDEVIRFIISRMSYIMFTQTKEDTKRLISMGEEKWRVHTVGTTSFDDLEIDEEYKPDFNYDLILYHPDTIAFSQMYDDLKEIEKLISRSEHCFILYPNKDSGYEYVESWIEKMEKRDFTYVIKDNLPRPKFLCLLKYADQFIGNSSAGIYEAPYFKIPFINIGKRNQNRKTNIILGASDKIVDVLEKLKIDDDLRRKYYV